MTNKILIQYESLQKEKEELNRRIEKLQSQIDTIELEGAVVDKVRGGEGGLQSFRIEGFPFPEYTKKKMWLNKTKALLKERETDIYETILEIEQFISKIDDSYMRRIISLRVIDGCTWDEVANAIGGGNSSDSVKMMYHRYLAKN